MISIIVSEIDFMLFIFVTLETRSVTLTMHFYDIFQFTASSIKFTFCSLSQCFESHLLVLALCFVPQLQFYRISFVIVRFPVYRPHLLFLIPLRISLIVEVECSFSAFNSHKLLMFPSFFRIRSQSLRNLNFSS